MPTILAGARIDEHVARHRSQAEALSNSRYASNPASDVTAGPRNSSLTPQSKCSRNRASDRHFPTHPPGAPRPPRLIQINLLDLIQESITRRGTSERRPGPAG